MIFGKRLGDRQLLFLLGVIILFGLFVLSSASAVLGFERFGNTYHFLIRQVLFGILPGMLFLFLATLIPLQVWYKLAPFMLVGTFVVLGLVFVPSIGVRLGGALRWVRLGPITFQVAEIAKLGFIIAMAAWLARRQNQLDLHHGFLPFAIIVAILAAMLVAQPDVGTLLVFIGVAGALYFLAGGRLAHISVALLIGLALFGLVVKAAPYRIARIAAFINPSADPQGVGYHINQALIAVGSGGWLGVGLGHSRQKFAYLPEVATDSVFAVAAEEIGFLGSAAFVILLVFFIRRILMIARAQREPFAMLLVAGIGSWFAVQSFVNIAALTGLAPLTGIPLPFVSYGGTALAVELAAVGIVLRASREMQR